MSSTPPPRTTHPGTPRRPPNGGWRRRLLGGLAAGAMLAAGCVSDDGAAAPPDSTPSSLTPLSESDRAGATGGGGLGGPPAGGGGIVLAAALRTTGSCDALLGSLKAEALERVGPHGLGGGWYGPVFAVEERAAADSAEAGAATSTGGGDASAGSGGPVPDHSATNNQEAGVDEADLVKTDGRRLVVVSGRQVRVVDVTGPAPVAGPTIDLPEEVHGGELFLDGDRALVLTSGWRAEPLRSDTTSVAPSSGADIAMPAGSATSHLIELDLTAGQVVRRVEVDGSYLSARAVDGTVRVVVSSPTVELPFVLPANPAAEEAAEAANRAVIERSTIDQWLPALRTLDGQGRVTGEGLLVPCDAVHLPDDFAGFGTLAVLTVDLEAGPAPAHAVGVLTDGQTVYASTDRLVVATSGWVDPRVWESGDEAAIREASASHSTALHTFDITDPATAVHVASGALPGRLVDQFALDERGGLLRVATTEGEAWGEAPQSESFVTVLREAGGALEVVGRVGGLGVGEQIQSVRFLDDVAYVVTFRQIDPFYVVDLADPAAPRVTGELKIPGFSRYLHPIGGDVVVGVGMDATDDGRTTGAQLSLFDVSDPTAPRRVGQLHLGDDTWSTAADEHRAFLWWEPERLAVLPISDPGGMGRADGGGGAPFDGAVVVRIGAAGELAEVGRIAHPATEECATPYPVPEDPAAGVDAEAAAAAEECWRWQPPISRSVVVGEVLYTVSDGGVQANALADLSPRGFLAFER